MFKCNYNEFPKRFPSLLSPCSTKIIIINTRTSTVEIDVNEISYQHTLDYIRKYYVYYDSLQNAYHKLTTDFICEDEFKINQIIEFYFIDDKYQKISISLKLIDEIPPIIQAKFINTIISYKELQYFKIENYVYIYDSAPIKELKIINLPDKYNLGIFLITIIAVDSFNNYSEYHLPISVIDDKSPIIEAPFYIQIPNDTKFTETEINSLISVKDDFPTNIDISITNYLENYQTNGVYKGTIIATDSSNNRTAKLVTIEVVDYVNDCFWINDNEISTYTNSKIDVLKALNEIYYNQYHISKKILSYNQINGIDLQNKLVTAGDFHSELIGILEDGTTKSFSLNISVKNKYTQTSGKNNFWKNIKQFFFNLVQKMKSFFNNLASWFKSIFHK